MGGPVGKGK
uniref:Uncharacterized protein n=1 Tax=Arundo donax TaxID=35708 RepID=A0A0A9ERJ3_ARUDO